MKRALFSLLALAFCLSACTPAASPTPESEAASVAEETTETAQEETNAAQTAFPVGSLRGNGHLNETDSAWYRIGSEGMADGTIRAHLLKLDYATAREEVFHPQLGVKTLLDGGRRRTKNLYGVVKRTVPAGQVRQ